MSTHPDLKFVSRYAADFGIPEKDVPRHMLGLISPPANTNAATSSKQATEDDANLSKYLNETKQQFWDSKTGLEFLKNTIDEVNAGEDLISLSRTYAKTLSDQLPPEMASMKRKRRRIQAALKHREAAAELAHRMEDMDDEELASLTLKFPQRDSGLPDTLSLETDELPGFRMIKDFIHRIEKNPTEKSEFLKFLENPEEFPAGGSHLDLSLQKLQPSHFPECQLAKLKTEIDNEKSTGATSKPVEISPDKIYLALERFSSLNGIRQSIIKFYQQNGVPIPDEWGTQKSSRNQKSFQKPAKKLPADGRFSKICGLPFESTKELDKSVTIQFENPHKIGTNAGGTKFEELKKAYLSSPSGTLDELKTKLMDAALQESTGNTVFPSKITKNSTDMQNLNDFFKKVSSLQNPDDFNSQDFSKKSSPNILLEFLEEIASLFICWPNESKSKTGKSFILFFNTVWKIVTTERVNAKWKISSLYEKLRQKYGDDSLGALFDGKKPTLTESNCFEVERYLEACYGKQNTTGVVKNIQNPQMADDGAFEVDKILERHKTMLRKL